MRAAPTLREVWHDYKLTRDLKPMTIRNYNQRLNAYLVDWLDKPLSEITKDFVEERHRSIEGRSTANYVMRTLRALFMYASKKYVDDSGNPVITDNPVGRLTELRAWHREKRRTSVLRPAQLASWFQAVLRLENDTMRDYLLVLLFTGMRRSEALNLRWDTNVDLNDGVITLQDTKNGDTHCIPMSRYVRQLLALRRQTNKGIWVFPSRTRSGPMSAGHKSYAVVTEMSGVPYMLHDLRRTFITVADEVEIHPGVIKALVNHRSDDVTDGYTIRSTERLRAASQRITDRLLYYVRYVSAPNTVEAITRDEIAMASTGAHRAQSDMQKPTTVATQINVQISPTAQPLGMRVFCASEI